jgi:hypothetical protein
MNDVFRCCTNFYPKTYPPLAAIFAEVSTAEGFARRSLGEGEGWREAPGVDLKFR